MCPQGMWRSVRGEILRYLAMDATQREAMGQRGREWILANRRYRTLAQNYLTIPV